VFQEENRVSILSIVSFFSGLVYWVHSDKTHIEDKEIEPDGLA